MVLDRIRKDTKGYERDGYLSGWDRLWPPGLVLFTVFFFKIPLCFLLFLLLITFLTLTFPFLKVLFPCIGQDMAWN